MKKAIAIVMILLFAAAAVADSFILVAQIYDQNRDRTICVYESSTGGYARVEYAGVFPCPRVN